jgi:RNA polymerase sigma factor (sigma-70 family)
MFRPVAGPPGRADHGAWSRFVASRSPEGTKCPSGGPAPLLASAPVTSVGTHSADALIERAQTGDEAAWSELYDWLAPTLRGYLRVRGAADPDDLLGEVFLHLARGIDGFEGTAAGFRSWVFVIATSRLHDERRRLRRHPVEPLEVEVLSRPAPGVDVEADCLRNAVADEVRALLAVLTPEQRAVVELRVFGELTSEEVGVVLGKPTGAVKALYRRALGALRRELDRDGAGSALVPETVHATGPVPLRASVAVTGTR